MCSMLLGPENSCKQSLLVHAQVLALIVLCTEGIKDGTGQTDCLSSSFVYGEASNNLKQRWRVDSEIQIGTTYLEELQLQR